MSKTYKLIPPKHISEKMLAEYNIATLDEAQVDNLQFTSTINPHIRHLYSGPIIPNKVGDTIKIDGMCNPSGRMCKECTSNTQNTPADKAQHCLRQLADGKCEDPYVQHILGETLFPSKKYHKKPASRRHKSILELIKDSQHYELDPDVKLTPDMNLKNDLNFDSLDIVEIFIYIEDYYNMHGIRFQVNEETIGEPQTVGDIIQIVNEAISKQR